MHSTTSWIKAGSLIAALCTSGCQQWPDGLADGVDYATRRAQTRDAHVQRVDGFAALRFDDASRDRLIRVMAMDDLVLAKQRALVVLSVAHATALQTARTEWDRLTPQQQAEVREHYTSADVRLSSESDPWMVYARESDASFRQLAVDVEAARTVAELHAQLRPIFDNMETPVKDQGRLGRMAPWLLFTLPSQIALDRIYADEFRGNADVAFASATVYRPASDVWDEYLSHPLSPADAATSELLARYAPVIVQEAPTDDAAYPAQDDRIGTVVTPDTESVDVRTDVATVYAYGRSVEIAGRAHRQLTYTHWYPEHPALKPNDPEAGRVEGVTLRLTLDLQDRPAFFETLYNCGCYHRLYPAERWERHASDEFGLPSAGKAWAIEREVPGRKDLIVPNPVVVPLDDAGWRPVIRVRAGWHGIVDVGTVEDKHAGERHASATYRLSPYEALERTTTADGRVASVFYDNGLVKGAQRREGVYFTPAGILSAGQPRQRGTQLIVWDDWNFDDPHLLEQALRLPGAF